MASILSMHSFAAILAWLAITALPMFYDTPRSAAAETDDAVILLRFGEASPGNWQIVNDSVMGGRSSSRVTATEQYAIFEGTVSLENNGGFASMRTQAREPADLRGFSGLSVHAKGDGKIYSLRIKTIEGNRITPYAHEARFTAGPEWEWHQLRFEDFSPVYRGRSVPDAPALNTGAIAELGFMIRDGQQGPFELLLQSIGGF